MSHTEDIILRNNSKRARITIIFFSFICLIDLVSITFHGFSIPVFESFKSGSDAQMLGKIENKSDTQTLIMLFRYIFSITAFILFLRWFRRAYGNIRRMKLNPVHYESMPVLAFFMPFVFLYRPHNIAREIFEKNINQLKNLIPDYTSTKTPGIVALWWIGHMIGNFVLSFVPVEIFIYVSHDQLIQNSVNALLLSLFDLARRIITIIMIYQMSKDEKLLFNYYEPAKRYN